MATTRQSPRAKRSPGWGGVRIPGPGKRLGAPRRSALVPLSTRVKPEEREALERWRARHELGQSEAVRLLLGGLRVAENDREIKHLYDCLILRLRISE